jgi:hypothetical protein
MCLGEIPDNLCRWYYMEAIKEFIKIIKKEN